ncbi:hypothetical protein [Sinomonas terrae]|uniref:Uncharacterized protein n=1 Tax=Sinomonas terrae TaxID=2908838 RepID=A0ABS9U534_9MICC|nr:hypothetical protein [Sinomonas terrae]MCH6471770.1 hypothetical protein [Sinomonas terrae]
MRHSEADTVRRPLTLVADGDAFAAVYFPGRWTLPGGRDLTFAAPTASTQ